MGLRQLILSVALLLLTSLSTHSQSAWAFSPAPRLALLVEHRRRPSRLQVASKTEPTTTTSKATKPGQPHHEENTNVDNTKYQLKFPPKTVFARPNSSVVSAPEPKLVNVTSRTRRGVLGKQPTTDSRRKNNVPSQPPSLFPQLILKDGQLRVEPHGHVILDGLSPTTWSTKKHTTTPTIGDDVDDNDESKTSLLSRSSSISTSLFLKARIHDEAGSEFDLSLGTLATCHRLVACARLNRYWMGPAFGTSAEDIPLDTQFLLVELKDGGQYALLLPLVDSGFRATLQGATTDVSSDRSYGDTLHNHSHHKKHNLEVICYSESGDRAVTTASTSSPSGEMTTMYVAVGDDPFALLKTGFRQVADETGTFRTLDQKQIPSSVDDFGWCTWDAFYSKVTPEGIVEGVKALNDAGVPPRNLILDDGWQTVTPDPTIGEATSKEKTAPNDFAAALWESFIDPIVSAVAKAATDYYVAKVAKAPHDSVDHKLWTLLAHTVLKQGLWDYFDSATDFARQLGGFQPNVKFEKQKEEAIPDGSIASLKDLVTILKTDLGVKHVYCWHAIHGYWRGISTELGNSIGIKVTQVFPQHTERTLQIEPQAAFDPTALFGVGIIQNADELRTFYRHLHAPLSEAGVDGVKVDVQSGVTAAGSGVGGGPHIARIYTQAMEESVAKNFPSSDGNGAINAINCMCHSTENLYRYRQTSVARASEDFFPDREESHTVHLVNVAYNSMFLGEICLPDWDMFHSKHNSAELHAAARAIGGCPIYVSDVPGDHNGTLLKKLVLPSGRTLRAQLPGRPTRDCLFANVGQDGVSALKIWNHNKAGNGVVGAFHVQGVAWNFTTNENEVLNTPLGPLTASVKPFDVETLRHGNAESNFAIWRHQAERLDVLESGFDTVDSPLERPGKWEIFNIAPIQESDEVRWAPIGLSNMMNSGGAIEYSGPLEQAISLCSGSNSIRQQSTTIGLSTHGPGRFIAYCQPAPSSIIIDKGQGTIVAPEVSFSHDVMTGLLSFDLPVDNTRSQQPHQLTIVWDKA